MDCSTAGCPVHTYSQSLLKLISIESVMPSNHLILCVPHSLGRSLCVGGEEPDSQALCVLPGPRADSPEAPGSLGRSCQAALTRLALEPGSSPSLAGPGWDGRADGVRAAPRSPGAEREAGPEGHVTPCQSDSARWRCNLGGKIPPSAKWFTVLDLKDAFFCIPLAKGSQFLPSSGRLQEKNTNR